jgi:hypothetical protein
VGCGAHRHPSLRSRFSQFGRLYRNIRQILRLLGVADPPSWRPHLVSCVVERATHDDTRHGVTNLYAALDVASGKVISQMTLATVRWGSSVS